MVYGTVYWTITPLSRENVFLSLRMRGMENKESRSDLLASKKAKCQPYTSQIRSAFFNRGATTPRGSAREIH